MEYVAWPFKQQGWGGKVPWGSKLYGSLRSRNVRLLNRTVFNEYNREQEKEDLGYLMMKDRHIRLFVMKERERVFEHSTVYVPCIL